MIYLNRAKLKEKRESCGFTLAQVGAKTGYSDTYIGLVEKGARSISVAMFELLLHVYGVDQPEEVAYFFDKNTYKGT